VKRMLRESVKRYFSEPVMVALTMIACGIITLFFNQGPIEYVIFLLLNFISGIGAEWFGLRKQQDE